MLRTIKRLLIPIIAISSTLAVILLFLFSGNYEPEDHEIVTVYCVTRITENSDLNSSIQYNYDDRVRILESIFNGKITSTYCYDQYGNPILYPEPAGVKVSATYDKKGNMLTSKHYSSDVSNPRQEYKYEYDKYGRLIKKVTYIKGEPYTSEHITYNANGDLLTRSIYSKNDSIQAQFHNAVYDESGNLLSFKMYYGETLRNQYAYTYDTAGRIITSEYIMDGETVSKEAYEYDPSGRLAQTKIYSQNSAEPQYSTIDYEYDAYGNLLKEYFGGSLRCQWTYDDNGNVTSYDNGSSLTKWYYDSNGNMVKTERIYNDNVSTTEYTYTSYEVTKKEAEFIKAQQEEFFRLPYRNPTPKTYLEILEQEGKS